MKVRGEVAMEFALQPSVLLRRPQHERKQHCPALCFEGAPTVQDVVTASDLDESRRSVQQEVTPLDAVSVTAHLGDTSGVKGLRCAVLVDQDAGVVSE